MPALENTQTRTDERPLDIALNESLRDAAQKDNRRAGHKHFRHPY